MVGGDGCQNAENIADLGRFGRKYRAGEEDLLKMIIFG
jgi:hypothetical protein